MADKAVFDRESLKIVLRPGCASCEMDLTECTDPAHLLDLIFHLAAQEHCAPLIPEFLSCLDEACQEVFNNSAKGVYHLGSTNRVIDWRAGTSTLKTAL